MDSQNLSRLPLIQGTMESRLLRREIESMTIPRVLLVALLVAPLPALGQSQPQPAEQPVQAQPQQSQPAQPAAQPQTPERPKLKEILLRPGTIPNVAPEHQEAARKSREARTKIVVCQREASEKKIMPRYRTQYVLDCIDKKTD
jgi:hypothetical protein